MPSAVRTKSNNSLFQFFDDDDVPKNDVASSKQMEDLHELSKHSPSPGRINSDCGDEGIHDSDGYETGVEQGISEDNMDDTYVIINVESYECVQISASSNYLQSYAAASYSSDENCDDDAGASSQEQSSDDDTSDVDNICVAYRLENGGVYDTTDTSGDAESSPADTDDECADEQCEYDDVNDQAAENDNDDGPASGDNSEVEDEPSEIDSARDVFASVEDAVTEDEYIISHSDSPTEGRPVTSSDLSSRYHRYRTNVYGTDGEDLGPILITKSYIEKNKADAMSEGAKTYGELMSALKRRRAAELRREAENADTTIVKVVRHRETVNERIKGKGKIARSASPFTAVAMQPYTRLDLDEYMTTVTTPEESPSESNDDNKLQSERSALTNAIEPHIDSPNRISSIENAETTTATIHVDVPLVPAASSCSNASTRKQECSTCSINPNESTPCISEVHMHNTESVSAADRVTGNQNSVLSIQPDVYHERGIIRKENTAEAFEAAADYTNLKPHIPAVMKKKTNVNEITNQYGLTKQMVSRIPQPQDRLKTKPDRPFIAGSGVDLKKGRKPVLPAIAKKCALIHIAATEVTQQIQPVPNLEQRIPVGNILRAAQPVINTTGRCRKESASERVPVQLKSDAYYRNGQLELSILGIERICTTEPLNVKLTLLDQQRRMANSGKNPYKKTTARKQNKVARFVNRSFDATNRDVIHQRALWPPFNTYTDPEASRRHEQFFHGGP